jgi:endonuclease YncB( thermonuclease family)
MMTASLQIAALVGALALSVSPVTAEDVHITGHASVVDGDTLDVGPIRIRLNGIDAPEVGQTCGRADGREWDCASAAANRLEALIGDGRVDCIALEQDPYGRVVATCRSGSGDDIGEQLVTEGFAWAFVRYSKVYVGAERAAREAHLGIWQGQAESPWDYREDRWARAAAKSPRPGCPIKGNISIGSGERIYHTPWSASYDRTDIDESKGERWFCDEAEAIAAGWRPARSR